VSVDVLTVNAPFLCTRGCLRHDRASRKLAAAGLPTQVMNDKGRYHSRNPCERCRAGLKIEPQERGIIRSTFRRGPEVVLGPNCATVDHPLAVYQPQRLLRLESSQILAVLSALPVASFVPSGNHATLVVNI
jgi:hypothetical protein